MVRKIVEQVPDDMLKADLERYRRKAVELGATEARVITNHEVIIDERVRAKCMYPRCENYGACANCPAFVLDLDQMRSLVTRFYYAILFKQDIPFDEMLEEWHKASVLTLKIVSTVEADAFYDGYYLAVGFGGQACKGLLCRDKECAALQTGQDCRNPYRARPNMHAVGMDVYRMAARQGWDMYPVGESTRPGDVPCLTAVGLVLVY